MQTCAEKQLRQTVAFDGRIPGVSTAVKIRRTQSPVQRISKSYRVVTPFWSLSMISVKR